MTNLQRRPKAHIQRRQVRPHSRRCRLIRLARHLLRRADRARARRRRRAGLLRRALHRGAARTRARRALTRILLTTAIVNDDRLLLRDARLQDILAQIRNRRALRLQHVVRQIRACARRRDAGLEHILRVVHLTARGADEAGRRHRRRTSATALVSLLLTLLAHRYTIVAIVEALIGRTAHYNLPNTNANGKDKNGQGQQNLRRKF